MSVSSQRENGARSRKRGLCLAAKAKEEPAIKSLTEGEEKSTPYGVLSISGSRRLRSQFSHLWLFSAPSLFEEPLARKGSSARRIVSSSKLWAVNVEAHVRWARIGCGEGCPALYRCNHRPHPILPTLEQLCYFF